HPQPMEIAVGVNGNRFIPFQTEGYMRKVTGIERLAVATIFRLDIDPLDEMLREHGVIHAAHVDMERAVFYRDNGQVLFSTGLHRVGFQCLHLFTAADNRYAGVVNHSDQVSAVAADIKFGLHSSDSSLYIIFNSFLRGPQRTPGDACRRDKYLELLFQLPC